MSEKSKRQKRCFVSDEDVSTLLQRYGPATVLALLQEVAQVREVNIDWNELVKKTKTGITNAREYQLLWRHLAYRQPLAEGLVDGAQPLDDDSDLEYELESYSSVSSEASMEAAACVKVLIASGTLNDSHMSNGMTIEAPLTINIPNGQRSESIMDASPQSIPMLESNFVVPVTVPKNPLPSVISSKGLDVNGASGANLPQRKRKLWSETEDRDLIAAVKRHGEGNWTNMANMYFSGYRTASQLSKRWGIIKKQQGSSGGNQSKLSEIHLAHQAVNLSLNIPIRDNLKSAACSVISEGGNANAASNFGASSMSSKKGHPKNAFNIVPGGGFVNKPSLSANTNSLLSNVQHHSANLASPNLGSMVCGLKASMKVASSDTQTNHVAELGIKTVEDTTALSGLENASVNQASSSGFAFRKDQIAACARNSLLEHDEGEQIAIPGDPAREENEKHSFSDDKLKENSKGNHEALVDSIAPILNSQSQTEKPKIVMPFNNGNHAKKSCS
ncbi:unnamed protein product [Cuscuta epithymum]|uniref:Uncharacterized protein n=1 Tax=Cuscuta epithymum TaxID=186058 RepID=A0AAV0EGN1_9ASTE|nr:unnamed protein product [Cuscuta epithymum]